MFPPDRDREAGHVPAGVRGSGWHGRLGGHGRPASLVVAVMLLAAFWVASACVAVWAVAHDHRYNRAGATAGLVLWAAVLVLVLWRVWRGDRRSIRLMARLATRIGVVLLVCAACLTVLTFTVPPGGSVRTGLVYLLAALAAGVALLGAGILLRRPATRDWSGL